MGAQNVSVGNQFQHPVADVLLLLLLLLLLLRDC